MGVYKDYLLGSFVCVYKGILLEELGDIYLSSLIFVMFLFGLKCQ